MRESIFSFFISKSDISEDDWLNRSKFGDYIICTDKKTPLDVAVLGDRMCAIFGYATDVVDDCSKNVAEHILTSSNSLQSVIEAEYKLGGKYILLYKDSSGHYLLGDATCSVPIYYTEKTNEFICTSNPASIIKDQGLLPTPALLSIRKSGDISQAMPFDITEYAEIKQLIPNHYLSFEKQAATRYVNSPLCQKQLDVKEATKRTKPLIERLTRFYTDNFKIYCPITSGRDSRVVLSFLSTLTNDSVECYTIKHPEHSDNEQDLIIPQALASQFNINYLQIEDIEASDTAVKQVEGVLGKGRYSRRTLNIAHTIKSHFPDSAIITGDIIGQIGKCSLHRDIPILFASARYFRCKLHNYSQESIKFLNAWIKDARDNGERVNIFDLFSIENRMGRWASQTNSVYNAIGQLYLNVFNTRSIIYTWTAVSRGKRKKALLHKALIESTTPELLSVPFESSSSTLIKLSKSSGLLYFLSSYLKYYMDMWKFKREKK